ncbi:hypothetical protein [Aquibacillus albus]
MERGLTHPSFGTVLRILKALNLNFNELVECLDPIITRQMERTST